MRRKTKRRRPCLSLRSLPSAERKKGRGAETRSAVGTEAVFISCYCPSPEKSASVSRACITAGLRTKSDHLLRSTKPAPVANTLCRRMMTEPLPSSLRGRSRANERGCACFLMTGRIPAPTTAARTCRTGTRNAQKWRIRRTRGFKSSSSRRTA